MHATNSKIPPFGTAGPIRIRVPNLRMYEIIAIE